MCDQGDAARDRFDRDKIRQWQLAILKFAVTLNAADEAAVLVLARHLDRIGTGLVGATSFFVRTSTEVCRAIATAHQSGGTEVLRRFLSWIDEPRLRAAFVGATGLDPVDHAHFRRPGGETSGVPCGQCGRGRGGYEVVVERHEDGTAWLWEICRDGRQLAVRLREVGFKSENTARASGRVALRDFLAYLKMEKNDENRLGL